MKFQEKLNSSWRNHRESPRMPARFYSDGIANLDFWLPQLQPQVCFADPPEDQRGCRWLFDNGRLVSVPQSDRKPYATIRSTLI